MKKAGCFRARRAPFLLPLLLALGAPAGCAQVEVAKGDVLRVERRSLPPEGEGYRLARRGPGRAALQRVKLCPLQERRTYQEVKVRRESAALAGAAGAGCGVWKFAEITSLIYGLRVRKPSDCAGASFTDRRPTGGQIEGPWKTVRREVCGAPEAAPPGGSVRVTFLRSGGTKTYTLGEGGTIRFPKDDLTQLRLYLTILREVEVEVRYGAARWRQKIDLE